MPNQSSIFPIFLRAEYRGDGQGFAQFRSEAQRAAAAAKSEFQGVATAINAALTRPRGSSGALDLGVPQIREAIRSQEQLAIAAREVANATRAAVIASGESTSATIAQVRAAFDLARAKEEDVAATRAQLAALEAVQAQLNQTASATSVLTGENLRLAQAEAAAVNGAAMIAATLRGTALEADRATNSARESARVFQAFFAEQEEGARRAAAAQEALAASAAQLRSQLDPMFAAQQRFDQELARADDLLRAGAITTREYAAAQQLARDNLRQAAQAATQTAEATERVRKVGTTATQSVINSQRASRTAFIQLGQQLQDVAVQAQMGTNAFLIFGQQAPQAAFALSGLAESANKTQRAIGNVATFLSGPWGAAIFVGVAALGPLVNKLLETEKAAELAKTGADNLAAAQSVLGGVFDEVSGKIKTQNELLLLNARLTALNLQSEALAKRASAANTFRSAQTSTGFDSLFGGGISDSAAARAGVAPRQSRGQTNAKQARDLLEGVFSGRISADEALKRSARMDFAGTGATREEFQQAIIDRAFSRDAERVAKLINDSLDSGNLSPQLRRDRGGRGSGGGSRSRGGGSGGGASGQADQLARFADQAAEQIQRINERFDEQPRLIDAAAQATRQLDAIIADLEKRKPLGFEQLVQDAEAAKRVVNEALVRPIELIRQESEQRLAIEEALAAGQIDRAAALQEIFRLEQQIGLLNDEQREDIEDIVVREQQRLRVLRDQQAVFNAQLDVLGTVRRDLTDILSGRSTDFFGNFRQALQDLQGARLFEAIFGQTFRDIENELQKNTPQGRANAAYAEQVQRTADATEQVGDAAISLAEEFDRAFGILRGGNFGAANDNGGFNPRALMAQVGLELAGQGGITVRGNRPSRTEIARGSVIDLAKRISDGIGASIGAQLEDVLGPRFAGMLGEVIGGFVAGKTLGGTTGGILGGLEGLAKNIKGLEGVASALGKAGEGAAIGSQIAGLGKALGIKGSTTGAQIGGAIGSFIPIPGGNIIGAIAGNIIGGLFKKTPRASATIGGAGGSLGITSLTGTSGSLRDAAGNLGNSVLETINRIAEQLGATVNAGAGSVSIGQRKGNLRVDTQGRGVTKIGNGAIDFGEDAEAAIAFAVRDLIQDGVITGLRQSEQNLLRAAKDIEEGMRDVLTFRSVFDRLLEIRDPIAFATQQIDREFDRLRDVFTRANATEAEFADLAALKEIERARAIEDATDRIVGSLRELLDDLRMGDNGLSLRDRRSNTLSRFDALAARVAAGDSTAFDDFADISRQLLDIERQLFGSTQAYFDRLNQVTTLTERAISGQANVSPIGAAVPSAADESASIARAIESTSAEQVSLLRAINDNLITALSPVARPGVSGGGRFDYPLPAMIQNF